MPQSVTRVRPRSGALLGWNCGRGTCIALSPRSPEIPFPRGCNTHPMERGVWMEQRYHDVPPHLPSPSPPECPGEVGHRGMSEETYVSEDGGTAILDPGAGTLVVAGAAVPVPTPAAAHEALSPQAVLTRGEVAAPRAGDIQLPHLGMESREEWAHGAQHLLRSPWSPHSPWCRQ